MQSEESVLQLSSVGQIPSQRETRESREPRTLLLDSYGTYKLICLWGLWFTLFICEMRSGTCQAPE